jgi:hypothetical protein
LIENLILYPKEVIMYRKGFFIRFVLALLLLAVLFAGGVFLYRTGWAQGYQAAGLIASSEDVDAGVLVPQFRGFARGPYMLGFGFPFFGLCLGIGFIFLVMFLMGAIFRPWGRKRWGGHPHYGPWKHGSMPPWAKEWEEYQRKWSQSEDEAKESEDDQPTAE